MFAAIGRNQIYQHRTFQRHNQNGTWPTQRGEESNRDFHQRIFLWIPTTTTPVLRLVDLIQHHFQRMPRLQKKKAERNEKRRKEIHGIKAKKDKMKCKNKTNKRTDTTNEQKGPYKSKKGKTRKQKIRGTIHKIKNKGWETQERRTKWSNVNKIYSSKIPSPMNSTKEHELTVCSNYVKSFSRV